VNDLEARITAELHDYAAGVVPRFDLEGVEAGRSSATPTGRRDPDRHRRRRLVAAAAVVLVAAAVGIVTATGTSDDARPAASPDDSIAVAADTPRTGAPGWAAMAPAPLGPRAEYTAVWTGTEMLVLGGSADFETQRTAAAYDPAAGRWHRIADFPGSDELGAVGAAVWTGDEALVLDTAGRLYAYSVEDDRWDERAQSPFWSTTLTVTHAVWTGTEMIVVSSASGPDGNPDHETAVYDRATDTWRSLPPISTVIDADPDDEQGLFQADFGDLVWTGSEAVFVGDVYDATSPTEQHLLIAALDPAAATWRRLPDPPLVDLARRLETYAAWTGTELIVGGGFATSEEAAAHRDAITAEGRTPTDAEYADGMPRPVADSAAWDPTTDTWRQLPDAPGPALGLLISPEVWTGSELVVWAVDPTSRSITGRPYLFDPATGTWRTGPPSPDGYHHRVPAVWTGAEILIWSGIPVTSDTDCCPPSTDSGIAFTPGPGSTSDDPATPTSASNPASPSTTTPVPATGPTPTAAEWTRACVEVPGVGTDRPPSAAVDLTRFGPLASEPTIRIHLPEITGPLVTPIDGSDGDTGPPGITTAVVPGGIVVAGAGDSSGILDQSIVARIDLDGSLVWVRCPEGDVTVFGGSSDAAVVLTRTAHADGAAWSATWSLLSTADGSVVDELDATTSPLFDPARIDSSVAGVAGARVLVVPGGPPSSSPLAVVDLANATVETIPPPDEMAAWSREQVDFTLSGDVVAFGPRGPDGTPVPALGVWTDGAWSDDPSTLATVGVRVEFDYDDQALAAFEADGTELWRRTDLATPGLEGSTVLRDGDVAVLQACTAFGDNGVCESYAVVGLDLSTGRDRWSIPGFRFLTAGAADGYALVSTRDATSGAGDDGYVLVDDRTGEPVPGQAWTDGNAFYQGCCGESEYRHVARTGGVVVVTAATTVSVWLPSDTDDGAPTHEITIPPS
jgi:hypothetical protein